MTDRMRTAVDRLSQRLKDYRGQSITYCRGHRSVTLTAVRSAQDFEQTEESGVVTRVTGYGWLVRAEDLVLNGSQVEPCREDVITDANGFRYQVLPMGDEHVFRRIGGYELAFEIHSKQVA